MQNDHTRHYPTTAPAHHAPPQWAADAADLALFRERVRPSLPRDLTKARHFYSGPNGDFVEGLRACRADQFCRCRGCKPPLARVRALHRLRIGLITASIVVAALLFAR